MHASPSSRCHFSSPNSFCPERSGQCGKSSSTSRPYACRTLFARCCCHLSPQFQPFRGSHPHCTDSPSPCWHHNCSQQLLDTSFQKALLKGFILLNERETDPTLLACCFCFCPPNFLDPRSLVNAQGVHVVTLDQYSCLNPSIRGSEVARPYHLINVSSHNGLQSLIAWHCSISINFLVIYCKYGLMLKKLTYSHLVQTLQDIFLGYFTCRWQSLVLVERH